MEDAGTCSVCFERFSADEKHVPRVLVCGHSFCQSCLSDMRLVAEQTISCPKCRHETHLAGKGVKGLPKNFDVLDLLAATSMHQEQKTAEQKVPRYQGENDRINYASKSQNVHQITSVEEGKTSKETKEEEAEDESWTDWLIAGAAVGIGVLGALTYQYVTSKKEEEDNDKEKEQRK